VFQQSQDFVSNGTNLIWVKQLLRQIWPPLIPIVSWYIVIISDRLFLQGAFFHCISIRRDTSMRRGAMDMHWSSHVKVPWYLRQPIHNYCLFRNVHTLIVRISHLIRFSFQQISYIFIDVANICRGGLFCQKVQIFTVNLKKKLWWAEFYGQFQRFFSKGGSFAAPDPPCLRLWFFSKRVSQKYLGSQQSVIFSLGPRGGVSNFEIKISLLSADLTWFQPTLA
jgi:hypothetical protein